MGKYTAHNLGVINRALGVSEGMPVMTDAIYAGLIIVADKIMRQIDSAPPCEQSHEVYPVETGNLRESTAVAIYVDGVVTVFKSTMDLIMNEPQEWGGNYYWGRDQLAKALQFGQGRFGKGVWIVLFASQPYAAWLNENHTAHIGYFDEYAQEMETLVKQIVAARANAILRGNFKPKSAGKVQQDPRDWLEF